MVDCNCIYCAAKRREAQAELFSKRDKAIHKAARCRNTLVSRVRDHLELLARARANRCVTADDYEPFLRLIGSTHAELGNAAGAVFKHPAWEFTGAWTPSTRKTSNARYIRVWRLK